MKILVDAQLSPETARWISFQPNLTAAHLMDFELLHVSDSQIFAFAKSQGFDCILTKDQDFIELANRLGSGPRIIWVTCGNCSNARLHGILERALPSVLQAIADGATIVEIGDMQS